MLMHMFIAHLPAGYLLTHWLQKKFRTNRFLWVGLAASVFPDIDMLYFYFVDDRQTLHHHYWTHLPLVWFALWAICACVSLLQKNRVALLVTTIIFANIIAHFLLDSIVGGIAWLYPFFEYDVILVSVPAQYDFWVWSFVFHWTFLLEIVILAAAVTRAYLDFKKVKKSA